MSGQDFRELQRNILSYINKNNASFYDVIISKTNDPTITKQNVQKDNPLITHQSFPVFDDKTADEILEFFEEQGASIYTEAQKYRDPDKDMSISIFW